MRACEGRNLGQAAARLMKHSAIELLLQCSRHGSTALWRREMKKPLAKLLLGTSAALVMLIAAEAAQAQEYQSEDVAYRAYDTEANPNYGFGPRVTVHPDDVVSGNRIIGRDPDPFIRGEILRHYDSGWPD